MAKNTKLATGDTETVNSESSKPMQASPYKKFIKEVLDCRRMAKIEKEHAAAAKIKQLKAQLEKTKCCGRCMHGTETAYLFCEKLKEHKSVRSKCDAWEAR